MNEGRGQLRKKLLYYLDSCDGNIPRQTGHSPTTQPVGRGLTPPMQGLRIPRQMRKKVDLLICAGESAVHRPYETRTAAYAQLWATKTGLGWVVDERDCGNSEESTSSTVQVNSLQARTCLGCSVPIPDVKICCQLRCCDRQQQGQKL